MNIINENKASAYLENHYDEIKEEIHKLYVHQNIAGIFQAVVNFLRFLLESGQVNKIGKCITVMEPLYNRGNEYLRYIIENLFIRSFDGIKRRCSPDEWSDLYRQIPLNLKKVYTKQEQEQKQNKLSL